jgi:hypothetical protein
MQHAFGEFLRFEISRAEAENIGGGDGFGRDAEDVANDAADSRVRAAERLNGRG